MWRILVGAIVAWLAAMPAASQDNAADDTSAANRVQEALDSGAAEDLAPTPSELEYLDDEGRAALEDSLTAYYRYRETGFEHRRAVFDWQLLSSRIIFAVVILLVLIGVYFSWLQFMAAARSAEAQARQSGKPSEKEKAQVPAAEAKPAAKAGGLMTTIEASTSGFKVSSPVLGVIILVISLAFFYLYLVHVYPIEELF